MLALSFFVIIYPNTLALQLLANTGIGIGMSFVDGSCAVVLARLMDEQGCEASYGMVFAAAVLFYLIYVFIVGCCIFLGLLTWIFIGIICAV